MVIPNPNPLGGKGGGAQGGLQDDVRSFDVPDLSLPDSFPVAKLDSRNSLLKLVDQTYRRKVETAQFSSMDTFRQEALRMILAPEVRKAFDITQESQKTRDGYGSHRGFGQSAVWPAVW